MVTVLLFYFLTQYLVAPQSRRIPSEVAHRVGTLFTFRSTLSIERYKLVIEKKIFCDFLGAFILGSPELKRVISNHLSVCTQRWKEKYSNSLLQISNKLISNVIVVSSLRFLNKRISGVS